MESHGDKYLEGLEVWEGNDVDTYWVPPVPGYTSHYFFNFGEELANAAKPATKADMMRGHEDTVRETLDKLAPIEKEILYKTLHCEGARMYDIDSRIRKLAKEEWEKISK